MKQDNYTLIAKRPLSAGGRIWQMKFDAPDIEAAPGQFVNILVDGHYLRRPISVSEYDGKTLTIVVDVVGDGTRILVDTPEGAALDMLTGLGNTFTVPTEANGHDVLLIGGGVGYAPLVGLLKKLRREGIVRPMACFGFATADAAPLLHIEELRREGYGVEWATLDGTAGFKGNAVELAARLIDTGDFNPTYFYTCGPMAMMNAVAKTFDFDGQLSLEARMGCGFGGCMGCTIRTAVGPKRICKEGPVFTKRCITNCN